MTSQWTSRVARAWATLFRWSAPYPPESAERDADGRRMRIELDAIRVRFADHA